MRESILHDLYFGRISPWEREQVHTEKYRVITKKWNDIVAHFKNLLSSEEFARFEEMQSLWAEAEMIDDAALFEYGFRLGALMMIDIFGFKETN